jgi:hypothetical protein
MRPDGATRLVPILMTRRIKQFSLAI